MRLKKLQHTTNIELKAQDKIYLLSLPPGQEQRYLENA